MEEIWKPIENYETYSVSTFGNIKNDKTGRILKGAKSGRTNNLHLQVCLYNKTRKHLFIHRLVALSFIPNPENKEQVDHIDNDISNNNVTNLRWATNQENQRNTTISLRNTSGVKGVNWCKQTQKWCAQIRINGKCNTIGRYNTIEEATIVRQVKANELFGSFTNSCELIKI
jgi:hypothetical protein